MAFVQKQNTAKKIYRLVFSHDNNYCSMPTYLYNTSSNKLEAFSVDTNFRLKDKSDSLLSYVAELERQKNAGLQNKIDVLNISLRQTIFPREENTFLSGTIKRENYSFPWKDSASDRYLKVSSSQLDSTTISYFNASPSTRLFSYWPMDCNIGTAPAEAKYGELMNKVEEIVYNILYARFGRNLLVSSCTPDNAVHIQAGKGPFPNSYDDFVKDIKLIYKDYSVIPEYTFSDKFRNILVSGSSIYDNSFNVLSLQGSPSYTNNNLFLERHVHSDYIESSGEIPREFTNYDLKKIKISVNGVKKFLPYEGLYPQQRSLQLSTLFSQSIAPSTTLSVGGTFRTVSNWVFSRGLYNSIRAGVACDIPLWRSGVLSDTGTSYERFPFLSLINPNSQIQNGYEIYDNEPYNDSFPNNIIGTTASFGQSDGIYDLAINNFVAETCNFFLDGSKLTTIKSKPRNEWKFDFGKYSCFAMNVVLRKNSNFTNHDAVGYYGYPYNYFAPPYYGLYSTTATTLWSTGTVDCSIAPSASWYGNRAVATILFDAYKWSQTVPSQDNIPIPTIQDIISYSTISFVNQNIKDQASSIYSAGAFMPLTASVNLFDYSEKKDQWNIHTIWECPVHNFVGVSTLTTASTDGGTGERPGEVHRGTWHQYSTNTISGLSLSLEYSSSISGRADKVGSLIESCGFDLAPQRVGNLADKKSVKEYVVVIPYIVDDCEIEKYFKIPLDKFEQEYKRADFTENDNSIRDMVRKSRKCVLPPRLNFTYHRDKVNQEILDEGGYSDTLPPFAMYIYEFSSTLSRQDLSNIWQGVSPSLSDISEFQNINIEHTISENEVLNPSNLEPFGGNLPENVRFKVFKVKARSLSSYDQLVKKTLGERYESETYSFNWPYDYFSLVEMAKVDVELSYEEQTETPQ